MITQKHPTLLAALLGTLALGMHPPVLAQSPGSDGALAQIGAMMPAQAGAADTATAQAFDTAMEDYERCHWLLAFEQLVRLADRGHVHAARMAMQMHQYGPGLYGQAFALPPGQVERFAQARWQAQVRQPTNAR
jgi:hypothetical protein